ncbi:hypothetical protein ACJJTC_019813 [Scirpophaga incertulas]
MVPDVIMPVPKKKGPANREEEAMEWQVYGRQNINRSKNMRVDRRSGAILAMNNLHIMIGELMEELKKKEAPPVTSAPSAPPEPEMRAADAEGREEEIRNVREGQESMERMLQVQTEIINKTHQETEKIRQQLETEKSQIAGGTYAQILQGRDDRVAKRASVLHSVIVASKDDKETGEEVLEKVRKTVNAKDGWVKVDRVRKAKDRKVIISCGTEEERRRVKERLLGAKKELTVEEIKNHDPLVILRDVLYVNTDEETGKALKNQNKEIFKVSRSFKSIQKCMRVLCNHGFIKAGTRSQPSELVTPPFTRSLMVLAIMLSRRTQTLYFRSLFEGQGIKCFRINALVA